MIKKIISLVKEKVIKLFSQFPVSIIAIIIMGLFLTIFTDSSSLDSNLLEKITLFLLFFIMGSLFSETFFKEKKYCVFIYILFAIISIILVHLTLNDDFSSLSFKILVSYIVIINLLTLYKLYKKSNESVSTYLVSVFGGIFRASVIYGILAIGFSILTSIFGYLFLENDSLDLIFRLQILLFSVYLIPSIIYTLSNVRKENSVLVKVIVHYVLTIQVIIAFGIIYLYMLKILFTLSFPSNEIFRILALLFIFALPVWLMNDYYKGEPLYKVSHFLPLLFIPFIILELYALGIRIINNGVTSIRYVGLLLIVFQIIFIWIYYSEKLKMEYNIFIIIGLTIFSLFMPFMNIISVTNLSQVLIIKKNIDNNDKSIKVVSAYNYLKNNFDGDKYIDRYLKNESNKLLELINNTKYNHSNHHMYAEVSNNTINISGYQKITPLSSTFNDKVVIEYNNKIFDITEEISIYSRFNDDKELNNYFEKNNEIIIDDNFKIILTSLSIGIFNEKIDYCNLNGYILEK